MSHLQFSDREVERVFAGQQPHGRPELAEVAFFFARLRALGDFERSPAMSPALRAQVEAAAEATRRRSVGAGRPRLEAHGTNGAHGEVELVRLDARRRAKSARLRWRMVGAAAVVVTLGGAVAAGLQGIRHRPEVEAETVVDPADETTTTAGQPVSEDDKRPSGPTDETPPGAAEIPDEQPEAQVETDTAPVEEEAPTTTAAPAAADDLPEWWPDNCPRDDWRCVVDHFDDGSDRSGRDDDDRYP
jgi:hypothetical protein